MSWLASHCGQVKYLPLRKWDVETWKAGSRIWLVRDVALRKSFLVDRKFRSTIQYSSVPVSDYCLAVQVLSNESINPAEIGVSFKEWNEDRAYSSETTTEKTCS